VRVVHWNGSTWTELDRVVEEGSAWNSATTRLAFRSQAAIGTSASDAGYYLYYGYPAATGPPASKANVYLLTDGFETGTLAGWDLRMLGGVAWYNKAWAYRKKITLATGQISGTHTDFPVLVSVTDAALITKAQSDFDDILFTSSDGATKLSHEIESFNPATGALVAWVKMPTLSTSANVLYLYYGNASAGSQQNATGTWDLGYKGVWHLSQSPTAGAPQFPDSSSTANHATARGSMAAGAQVAGKVNGSLTLDGSNDYVSTSYQFTTARGYPTGPQVFTIEAWAKTTTKSGKPIVIFEGGQLDTYSGGLYDRSLYIDTSGRAAFALWDGSAEHVAVGATDLTVGGAWHHLVATFDTGANIMRLYVDGVEVDTEPSNDAENDQGYWMIGAHDNSAAGAATGYFPGSLDEVRVSTTVRAAGWVSTSYNNQSNPAGFHTFGAEESVASVFTAATDQKRSGSYALKMSPTSSSHNLLTASGVDQADLRFDAWWRVSTITGNDIAQVTRAGPAAAVNDYELTVVSTTAFRTAKIVTGTYSQLDSVANPCSFTANTWTKMSVIVTGTQLKALCGDAQAVPASGWTTGLTEHTTGSVGFRAFTIPASNNWWVDDVTARRYVDPEPTSTLGTEEAL
jgi:hypothetical protein